MVSDNNILRSRTPLLIAVGIMMLGLFLAGVAVAEESYEFTAKWGSFGSGDGQFYNPEAIAVDSSGNVYVADGAGRIQKFSASGVFITKWGSPGHGDGQFSGGVWGIAVDSSGNVYVSDIDNNRIQKFSASGVFITKWGNEGNGDGQFYNPSGIAVDSSGNVYVAELSNNRIQKFSASGVFITKWGNEGSGDGQLYFPSGIAVDSSGNVYVADPGQESILKFSATGGFITKWGSEGNGDGQFQTPFHIAVDSSGNVYVDDYGNYRIQKFSASGVFMTKWGSPGSGDGQFTPWGIAVDSSGNVYVDDYGNYRIQKFRPPATFISVSPSSATVSVGSTQLFTATDQGGNPISVDWSSSDTSVGTVSPAPGTSTTFTASKAGATTVTATSGGVVGSAEVTVENSVEAITKVSTIWENEDDGMIVPYDQVEMRFIFKNNLPTTLHNVKMLFKKNNLISFDKEETIIGDVPPGQFSNIEPVSIKIAGVENNDIMTKIINISGPGKIPLTNSIEVTVQYDSSSKDFTLTPTNISGKALEIQYPNFKTKVGDPIPKDDVGDYYMTGDDDFSHPADLFVRKFAVKAAATDGNTQKLGVFPDNPKDITFNVFRYVDDILKTDISKSHIENDEWIATQLEINDYVPFEQWICIGHSYLFTSFERAIGFPSREINVAEGVPINKFDYTIITKYWQNAAAEVYYDKKWNFFDPWTSRTEAYPGVYVNSDILNLDDLFLDPLPITQYKTWYTFNKQSSDTLYGEISHQSYNGHDFTISKNWEGDAIVEKPTEWISYKEAVKPGVIIIVGSPIEMLLKDVQGRRIGSTSTGIVHEIPGAKYMPPGQTGYSNMGDPSTAFDLDEYFFLPDGLNGKYDLVVTGTGDGEFTLQFAKFDPSAQNEYSGVTTFTGIIKKNEIQKYDVRIDETTISAIKIDDPPPPPPSQVPEFPALALPILSVIGLLFVLRRWR